MSIEIIESIQGRRLRTLQLRLAFFIVDINGSNLEVIVVSLPNSKEYVLLTRETRIVETKHTDGVNERSELTS